MSKRSRGWVITDYPHASGLDLDYWKDYIKDKVEKDVLKYGIVAEEETKTEKIHFQIYIYYKNPVPWDMMKKRFPKAHLELQLGTHEQASVYCKKTSVYFEYGELPKQGKRNDYHRLMELIDQGHSAEEIEEMMPDKYFLHDQKIKRLIQDKRERYYKENDREPLKVIYLSDKTGTGKSYSVRQAFKDKYFATNYRHPWDGYKGEEVVVLEEFRGDIPLKEMLNLLDHYSQIKLPSRYSDKIACYTTVVIISNWEYEEQYKDEQFANKDTYDAWNRRVKEQGEIHNVESFRKKYLEVK